LAAVPSIGRATLVEAPRVAPQAAATEGLYERHAAKIQSYCHHQLGSREEAEDAVQTTFMNAFRALGRGVVPEAESAWLFKIAENVCLSRRRSSWRRGKIESPSDFGVIEEIVPGPTLQRDELIGIEDALASMPEQQRRAILLREWQGLSYREIAAELEVSQSAVETLIFRARRSLAQGLEQPDSIKPKRKSFRRALHALDLGTVVAALKTVLVGGAAVKATVAAVAVTAAVGTAASVAPELKLKAHGQPAAVALVAPTPARSSTATASVAASVTAAESVSRFGTTPVSLQAEQKSLRSAPVAAVAATPAAELPAAEAEVLIEQQPSSEPAPAPAAEEPKHEQVEPAAEPARSASKRKQNEGKHKGKPAETPAAPAAEPAVVPVVASAPAERRGGNSKGRNDAKGKDAPVIAQAPEPALVTAAAPAPAETAKDQSSKKEHGRGNVKRELTSAPSVPTPTPVVASADPTAAPTDVVVAAAPQPSAAPDAHGKRKGK
jgi:RNA polymerase sigma factor (sigma-70 family)